VIKMNRIDLADVATPGRIAVVLEKLSADS
jgi:hypothetical protein